jgi:hypothetical protein
MTTRIPWRHMTGAAMALGAGILLGAGASSMPGTQPAAARPTTATSRATDTAVTTTVATTSGTAPAVIMMRYTGSMPAATERALQTQFESGDPIGTLFTAMAMRFHVIVVEMTPAKAYLLKDFTLTNNLEDALAVVTQALEAQGYGLIKSGGANGIILRVGSAKQIKSIQQTEGPVSYGRDPDKIDVSQPRRQITQIMPIENSAIVETLRRNASSDSDVTAEVMGGADSGMSLMIIGPAAKVQAAMVNVAKLDAEAKKPGPIAYTLALKRLSAVETAQRLNETFARETVQMKALAEPHTNALVITGPENRVMAVVVEILASEMARGPDERPAPNAIPLPLRGVVPAPGPSPEEGWPDDEGEGDWGDDWDWGGDWGEEGGRLDGKPEGGDNEVLLKSQLAWQAGGPAAPMVNKGTIPRDSEQLGGQSVV